MSKKPRTLSIYAIYEKKKQLIWKKMNRIAETLEMSSNSGIFDLYQRNKTRRIAKVNFERNDCAKTHWI